MAIPSSGIGELRLGGRYYGGWTKLSVTRSIEQIAGSFDLEVTERWAGQATARAIVPGEACEVLLDGETVIDGYIDDVLPEYDAENHTVRIAGRDKTGDLVDCSAVYKTGQWHSVTLDTLARDLIAPFGIGLVIDTEVGAAFSSYSIQEGETVFECLERAARMKAVLLVSDAQGNLVITRAGDQVVGVQLVEGQNILAASGQFGWKDRYSTYTVKGQVKADDDFFGENAAQPKGVAIDDTINRYRPLVVLAEEHGHGATLKDRAEWERSVRMGRGNRGAVTVQGWRRPDGALWQPNTLVPVRSPMLSLDAPMLIVGCTWRLDERGTTTQLTIARRESFVLVSGVARSKLAKKLNDKAQKEKKKKGDDWSML